MPLSALLANPARLRQGTGATQALAASPLSVHPRDLKLAKDGVHDETGRVGSSAGSSRSGRRGGDDFAAVAAKARAAAASERADADADDDGAASTTPPPAAGRAAVSVSTPDVGTAALVPTLSSRAKVAWLQSLGYRVVVVHWRDWAANPSTQEKMELLAQRGVPVPPHLLSYT